MEMTGAEVNYASVVGTSIISPDFTLAGLKDIDFSKTEELEGHLNESVFALV